MQGSQRLSVVLTATLTLCVIGCGSSSSEGVQGSGGTGGAAPNGGVGNTAGVGGSTAGSGGGVASGGASGVDAGVSDAGTLDPPPGEYGERAELLEANSEMAVAEVLGKIYVLGGYPASREPQTTVQVYDPATDSWDRATPLPFAVHHPVAVGVNGKLYSLGGQLSTGDTNRTLVWDPASSDPWLDRATMPTPRGAGAAAVIDDKIYVVGGRPPAANAFEVYDISDDAWTELSDLPQSLPERNHLAATAIAGKVYVAGGRYSGGSFSSPMTDSLDIYDPAAARWESGAPMLRPRGGNNGVAAFGCFFVWGGEGSNIGEPNNVFPDHDMYNPTTNTWTALLPLPVPVHGVTGAAFIDGLVYMPGGGTAQGGSSGSRLFQVYRPTMRCD